MRRFCLFCVVEHHVPQISFHHIVKKNLFHISTNIPAFFPVHWLARRPRDRYRCLQWQRQPSHLSRAGYIYRPGLLNYFKKGSSYKCQSFSGSGHSHKIMKMWHGLDFSNKKRNMRIWYDYTVYRYTKSGKWIQVLTNAVIVIYCSAGGSNGILCFLGVT